MKTLIICSLPQVFIIPYITTEKGNKLKFTKGTTQVDLSEENIDKLRNFTKPYGDYIKVLAGKETEGINANAVVSEMNKKTELESKKAALYSELEEMKNSLKDVDKKEIINKFKQFVTDEKAKKEDIIKQIEENIEKIEA